MLQTVCGLPGLLQEHGQIYHLPSGQVSSVYRQCDSSNIMFLSRFVFEVHEFFKIKIGELVGPFVLRGNILLPLIAMPGLNIWSENIYFRFINLR